MADTGESIELLESKIERQIEEREERRLALKQAEKERKARNKKSKNKFPKPKKKKKESDTSYQRRLEDWEMDKESHESMPKDRELFTNHQWSNNYE